VTKDPGSANPELAQAEPLPAPGTAMTAVLPQSAMPASYVKFTSQIELGHYLMDKYHIRDANQLSSCEVCHR
jgi:hypothetical protein